MADARLQIIIDATNQAKDDLDRLKKQLGDVDATAKKSSQGIGGMGGALNLLKLAAGSFIVREGIRLIGQLGEMGSAAERTSATFERVAGGADNAAAMLDALKAATMGTRSEVDLMNNATTLMALGMGDTAEELAGIMRNVEGLGARFGGTMQIFQLMMSNDSLMRIDSFGIGVEEATERIEQFKAAGMDAGEAFDTAILELMNEKFEQLGGNIEDNVTQIQRSKAAWADLKTEIGISFSGVVANAQGATGGLAASFTGLLKRTNAAREEFGYLRGTMAGAAEMLGMNNTLIDQMEGNVLNATLSTSDWRVGMGDLTEEMLQSGDAYAQYNSAISSSQAASDAAASAAEEHNSVLRATAGLANESQAAYDQYNQALYNSQGAADAAATNFRVMKEQADLARESFLLSAAALDEMSQKQFAYGLIEQLKNSGLAGEELNQAIDAILTRFGLLTSEEKSAQGAIDDLTAALLAGKIAPEAYAIAIDNIKKSIDQLDGRKVTVEFDFKIPALPNIPGPQKPQYQAAGGVSGGGYTMVGERGPEMVRLPMGAQVFNTPTTNNYYNLTMNTRATSASVRQDFALMRAMG